jgi:hypothetical protein
MPPTGQGKNFTLLFRRLFPFLTGAINTQTSPPGHYASGEFTTTLIAYAPDEKPFWVVAVLHGTRSPQTLAAILKSHELPN